MARRKLRGKKKTGKRRRVRTGNDVAIAIDNCVADHDTTVYLHHPNDDRAKWVSDDGQEYAVIFAPDTPFADHIFRVPANGHKSSGKILDTTDRDWKYRIVGSSGCDIDPKLHIGP